jgi:hypothetical protein
VKRLSFSDEMMSALAAGRKFMTRRPIKDRLVIDGNVCYPRPRFKVGDLTAATCAFQVNDSGESRTGADYRFNSPHLNEWPWSTARIMPAALAPFVLRITDVKSERVQDITEKDAKREGVDLLSSYRWAFELIWTRLYPSGPLEWDQNPFVWCYGFEIAERRI